MENQAEEEDFRDTDKPRYAYANQNMEDEDIAYPEQIPMEKMQYAQEGQNTENAQYPEEKLPPIYAKEIESVKETTEHQIKYFEPIQISSDQDVGKFLQSGQLMQQIAPKILALKQETQKQSISNDPLVHTQVTYDEVKQNAAIYNNPNNEDNQPKSLHNSQNDKLNATSSYSNNKYSLGQANYDMSKTQQFNKNNAGNLEGPGGIKYSSVLPPKYADKVITIDEYGNRQEEESQNQLELESQIQGELDEDPEDNDETVSQKEQQKQRNQMLERRKLEQEQLTQQNIQKQRLQKQQMEQQKLLLQQQQLQQQQLQQQQLQQQQLQQQQLQQQQLQQQQLKQQQLIQQQFQQQQLQQKQLQQQMQQEQLKLQKLQQIQQQLKLQKFPQQQLQQQQMQLQTIQQQILQQQIVIQQLEQLQQNQRVQQQLLQQKQLQQQIQQQRLQQQPSPYAGAYSANNLGKLGTNITQQNIQNNNQQMQIHYHQSKSPFRNITKNNLNQPQKEPIVQKVFKVSGKLRPKKRNIQSNEALNAAVLKIQNKWRNHFIKMRFNAIKPQLIKESENFLSMQYELCDKNGQALPDDDFLLEGWRQFYPINDPFFNFKKGFVIPYGIKIRHPNDPEKVQVYEGDININNQRHGFGRLTTTKSVFLGEWRNDEFTGWGRETRRSGKVLEGKYINGLVEGKGILKNSKGNTYVGDFTNSKRHGRGILDTHKIHYEGDFKNDKLSGNGKIIFKNEGHVYEGEFDNNEINGFGTFKWKNGDSYTGQMKNGKMHGKGRYRYNNGKVFEGTYANGIKQGKKQVNNNNPNLNSTISKNKDPKGLNMSGMTVDNNMKFGKK